MDRVIGTAGHVDHGKSALVRALTGIDPDRLAEERRRGMTIELGFVEWRLPSGQRCGIVDVPGHQRLVRTMIAGAAGIDLVLVVVAADEGVMPQTREHVDVCALLGVGSAVAVVTKADLVDEETAQLAALELAELLAPTPMWDAPTVVCSTRDGRGLELLAAVVDDALASLPPPPDLDRPRLFVDRAFSVAGFGPVVTGTLEGGELRVGDSVRLLPGEQRARVRGLERHGEAIALAAPGGRTAVNLAGVERAGLARGMTLVAPSTLGLSRRLDVALHRAASETGRVRHGAVVDVHLGSAQSRARLWLLDADELDADADAVAQLRLEAPLVAAPGDRVVIRRPSPAATVGGGEVLDVSPPRHRRRDAAVGAWLRARRHAPATSLVRSELTRHRRGADLDTLCRRTGLGPSPLEACLTALGHAAHRLGDRWFGADRLADLGAEAVGRLAEHHAVAPLDAGLRREEWRSRLRLPAAVADGLATRLIAAGEIVERKGALALPSHRAELDGNTGADAVLRLLDTRRLDAPAPAELTACGLTADLQRRLLAEGLLVRLGADVVLSGAAYSAARETVVRHLEVAGTATVAELRDALGATRRVTVPLLERLDGDRVTRREGDRRRLVGAKP